MDTAALEHLAVIAHEAGRLVMEIYGTAFDVEAKADNSPVTAADRAAEDAILAALARRFADIPVVSEEAAAAGHVPDIDDGPFFLVDPLDGTREFVGRNGEFTVNIALIAAARPVAGVVYAPAAGRLFSATRDGGAFETAAKADRPLDMSGARRISTRPPPGDGLTLAVSRSHAGGEQRDLLKTCRIASTITAGSSLKFCLLACGEADLYPRLGRTMEWDTAAGQAVLEAAGGSVVTLDGKPLLYGKRARGLDNPSFVARGWTGPGLVTPRH